MTGWRKENGCLAPFSRSFPHRAPAWRLYAPVSHCNSARFRVLFRSSRHFFFAFIWIFAAAGFSFYASHALKCSLNRQIVLGRTLAFRHRVQIVQTYSAASWVFWWYKEETQRLWPSCRIEELLRAAGGQASLLRFAFLIVVPFGAVSPVHFSFSSPGGDGETAGRAVDFLICRLLNSSCRLPEGYRAVQRSAVLRSSNSRIHCSRPSPWNSSCSLEAPVQQQPGTTGSWGCGPLVRCHLSRQGSSTRSVCEGDFEQTFAAFLYLGDITFPLVAFFLCVVFFFVLSLLLPCIDCCVCFVFSAQLAVSCKPK